MAWIQSLARELPHATGAAIKNNNDNNVKKYIVFAIKYCSKREKFLGVKRLREIVEDVYLKVPAGARNQGSWIISDKFYQAIFRMKDSTGNYILREGAHGLPSTILGRPFEIDETMAGATGEALAIFGRLSDYHIGDRGEMAIQRLDERYADKGLIGFKVYKRTDGKLATDKYVAMLKNA